MRIGKSKHWIRAALLGLVLGPATVSAEFPRAIETAARLSGVGWGDGYHACASSGIRLGADLPPRSYAASYGAQTKARRKGGIVHRIGATFYDRFDAANTAACGAIPSRSTACDGNSCDGGGPVATSHGSHVSQVRQAPSPVMQVQKSDIAIPPAPTPAVQSTAGTETSSIPEPVIELTQPLTFAPHTKKYPTRPDPPVRFQRSAATPVASKQPPLAFPNPANEIGPFIGAENEFAANEYSSSKDTGAGNGDSTAVGNHFPAVGNWGQTIATGPPSLPVNTATPWSIDPIHPGRPPSIPARLSLPGNPLATSTPVLEVSAPGKAPGEIVQPARPQMASAVAASTTFVPAYAHEPYRGLEITQTPATAGPAASPARLGTATAHTPFAAIKSSPAVKRPTRLGDAGAGDHPFAARPALEMAQRSGEASEGVIFQPSGGSLK